MPTEPTNQMLGAETATRRALGVGLVPPEQRGSDVWCVLRTACGGIGWAPDGIGADTVASYHGCIFFF
jgi:hypothetical protein